MTDLTVLLPEATRPEDVDRFCTALQSALARCARATGDSSPISVEIAGADPAAVGTPDELLQPTQSPFVVWVGDPGSFENAQHVARLFAQRFQVVGAADEGANGDELPHCQPSVSTPGLGQDRAAQTQVDTPADECVLLKNDLCRTPLSGSAPATPLRLAASPWGGGQPSATESATESAGGHRLATLHSVQVRWLIAVALCAAASCFLPGVASPTVSATEPVAVASASTTPESSTDESGPQATANGNVRRTAGQREAATDRGVVAAPLKTETARQPADAQRADAQRADAQRADGESRERVAGEANPSNLGLDDEAIEARLLSDVQFLAADEREGRGARTQGLDQAAEYLAEQFAQAGLNTAHYNGTPFQEFQLLSLGGESPVQQITFRGTDDASRTLNPDRDFASLVLSKSARLNVPVVFAGFGISAPEVGYDDYAGLDVTGKAVIVLRHAPPAFDSAANDLAEHSYVRTKIALASARGASAVLLCSDLATLAADTAPENESGRASSKSDDELLHVELQLEDGVRPVPVVHCRREVLRSLLNELGRFDLDAAEQAIVSTTRPHSRPVDDLQLEGHVLQLRRGRSLRNVVATLDPPDTVNTEAIIVGAHYDHLGRGGWGSLTLGANNEIHNGADDNASGTAVLLEVARQLAALESPLQRRVLFIGFSAEELGLIGSRRYVKEPLIPIDQSIAMLNLDMVGRLRNDRLTVYGTGSSKVWSPLLNVFAPRRELEVISRPSGYGPSDHASFYEAGVPVLHFFTGFHPQYHRPEDDVEHLNIEGMRRIAGLTVDLVKALAEADERPVRTLAGDGAEATGLLSALIGSDSEAQRQSRPLLGIVPASRGSQSGVLVRQTVSRSLADLYGIRTGDVIVRVGDTRVDSVAQLVSEVRAQDEPKKLPIELLRNGIRLEVEVDFQQ